MVKLKIYISIVPRFDNPECFGVVKSSNSANQSYQYKQRGRKLY